MYTSGYNIQLYNFKVSNCHRIDNSTFMTVTNATSLTSTNVTFSQLSSNGQGVFRAENVTAVTIQNVTFEKLDILQTGLVTITQNVTNLTLQNLTITSINVTNGSGGVFYSADKRIFTNEQSIGNFILTDMVIKNVTVKQNGGLFYLENPFIKNFAIDKINAKYIKADAGAVFYIADLRNELVIKPSVSAQSIVTDQNAIQNVYSYLDAQNGGIFLYSKATNISYNVQQLSVQCQASFSSNLTDLKLHSNLLQSVIYVENNKNNLTILNSNFSNCQKSSQGGVITLVSSILYDYGSIYQNNYARLGGIYYFFNSTFHLENSQFINIKADEGGILLVDRFTKGRLVNLTVDGVIASTQGGFMSVTFTSIEASSISTIEMTGSSFLLQNIQAPFGGLIYSNSPYMNITISNIVSISNISASSQGGLFFIKEVQKLAILKTQIRDISASTG